MSEEIQKPHQKLFEMSTSDLILCINLLEAEAKRLTFKPMSEDRQQLANRMRSEVEARDAACMAQIHGVEDLEKK